MPNGRETSRAFANGKTGSRAYGRDDNLPTAVRLSGDTGASFAYTYDSNKNPTGETVGSPMAAYSWATGTTGYDAEDRLVNFDRTGTANDQTWTLTKAGDWDDTTRGGTTEDRSHSAAHKITSLSPGTTPTYDFKGNILTDGTRTYTWDFDNLLTQIAVTGGPTITFRYDVLGRRLFRISTPTMGSATTTRYILRSQSEGGQTLAEEDNASGTYRLYVWGDYVDDLIARVKSDGTRHYFHANRMFSVAAVTDGSGSIVERYGYTAYGEPTILNASGTTIANSSISNNTLFTGREWDAEANIYYYRARYYDPRLGRFIGRDPIEYEDGVHLYSYTSNAPVSALDPLGLWKWVNGKRSGTRAKMQPEKGDTTESAALFTRLDPTDTDKWLLDETDGKYVPPGSTIDVCHIYSSPNIVYVVLGDTSGRAGFTNKFAINLMTRYRKQIESLGYYVAVDREATKDEIIGYLKDASIYGMLFIGHGAEGIIYGHGADTDSDSELEGALDALTTVMAAHHKLGFLTLYACEAGKNGKWRSLVSKYGTMRMSPGTLVGNWHDWDDVPIVP